MANKCWLPACSLQLSVPAHHDAFPVPGHDHSCVSLWQNMPAIDCNHLCLLSSLMHCVSQPQQHVPQLARWSGHCTQVYCPLFPLPAGPPTSPTSTPWAWSCTSALSGSRLMRSSWPHAHGLRLAPISLAVTAMQVPHKQQGPGSRGNRSRHAARRRGAPPIPGPGHQVGRGEGGW
jgi:hypothetical protein